MERNHLKKLVTESVLNIMNEASWSDVESKIDKWFKMAPSMAGNIKTIESKPSKLGRHNIVLHDKRGNIVVLVQDVSTEFSKKYLPIIGNLLSTLSGQLANKSGPDVVAFK